METPFKIIALCLLLLATAAVSPTHAVDYPKKPVRIISDSAPGSAVDVTFRIVMDRLGTVLGQQIVPVDEPGASGAIAAHAATEAPRLPPPIPFIQTPPLPPSLPSPPLIPLLFAVRGHRLHQRTASAMAPSAASVHGQC